LYYRLSTVEITPALRDRKDDIHLLFRKFASDFAHKYKMPPIKLEDDAVDVLTKYRWSEISGSCAMRQSKFPF
jgi:DNA-binding NtrC family response regulator